MLAGLGQSSVSRGSACGCRTEVLSPPCMRPPKRLVGLQGRPPNGADHDHTTKRSRDSPRARHPGSGRDRPDVSERLRSPSPDRGGSLGVYPSPSRVSRRFHAHGTTHHPAVCGGHGKIRSRSRHSASFVRERPAQGRRRRRLPRRLLGRRRRGLGRQGPGKVHGLWHREAPQSPHRKNPTPGS